MKPVGLRSISVASALTIGGGLLLTGCDNLVGNPHQRASVRDRDRLKPFRIGPASDWTTPGVSDRYLKEHNVFLVSDHGMLVALTAKSTEADVNVRWDPLAGLFRCPVTNATYTRDGLAWADSPASRALERCRIASLGPSTDPDVALIVDPQQRFRFEDNQWSRVMSNHLFVTPKPRSASAR